MNRFFTLIFCLGIVSGLGACKTTVQDGPTNVIIEDGQHGGGFCPPGQAKKGNC